MAMRYRSRRRSRRRSDPTFGRAMASATWRRRYFRGDGQVLGTANNINLGALFTLVNPGTAMCRIRGTLSVSALTRVNATAAASTGRISQLSFAVGVVPDGISQSEYDEDRPRIWRRLRRMAVPGYPVELQTKLPSLVIRQDYELKLVLWANDVEIPTDEIYYQWRFHGWEQFYEQ